MSQSYRYKEREKSLKTSHDQIISKTQLALEAIKRYEVRTSKFTQNKQFLEERNVKFQEMDNDYSRMFYSKELQPDKSIKIQIFPYHEEYYSINTTDLLFPIRLFFKNVRGEGKLYVGYDLILPGLNNSSREVRNHIISKSQRSIKNEISNKKRYNYQFQIKADTMISLLNQSKRKVEKIYLSFIGNQKIFMFSMKFDHIGFPRIQQSIQQSQIKQKVKKSKSNPLSQRIHTDPSSNKTYITNRHQQFILPSKNIKNKPFTFREYSSKYDEEISSNFQNNQNKELLKQLSEDKNFLIANKTSVKKGYPEHQKSLKKNLKEKSLEKEEKFKVNKEKIDRLKQKQRKLNDKSAKFKKNIQQYKKIYLQSLVQNSKANTFLCPLIFVALFIQKTHRIHEKQQKQLASSSTTQYYTMKFIKRLNSRHLEQIDMVPNFLQRNYISIYQCYQFSSKSIYHESRKKSVTIIFQTLKILTPALIVNEALTKTVKYRNSVKNIQRKWLHIYRARVKMLEYYCKRQAKSMIKQYKHLNLAFPAFSGNGNCHNLCYEYMAEESTKFRMVYKTYKKRLIQIQNFIQENNKIRDYNKGKTQKKSKNYLQIPKKPKPPQYRFFRNLDILKAMLRGWLELQYKKILKKNINNI